MGKVRVCGRSGRDSVIEGVAFTGDGRRAVTANGREEPGLPEGGLLVLDGDSVGVFFLLTILTGRATGMGRRMAAGAVDAEEILDSGLEVARLIGVFAGRERKPGEVPALFVHGGWTGREKLCHDRGGRTGSRMEEELPKGRRNWVSRGMRKGREVDGGVSGIRPRGEEAMGITQAPGC